MVIAKGTDGTHSWVSGGGGGGGGEGEETNKGRLRGKGILDVSWIGSVKTVSKS